MTMNTERVNLYDDSVVGSFDSQRMDFTTPHASPMSTNVHGRQLNDVVKRASLIPPARVLKQSLMGYIGGYFFHQFFPSNFFHQFFPPIFFFILYTNFFT